MFFLHASYPNIAEGIKDHHIKKMLNKRKYYIFSVVEILEENFIYPKTGGFVTTSFDKHSNAT
jgi:hypothetical protein